MKKGLLGAFLVLTLVSPAWAQCGVFKTWAFQEVLQSSAINSAFQRTVDANTPTCTQSYSASASQMQSMSDPYPGSSESLASTLSGELERLRFQVKALVGKNQWYYTADNSLAKDASKHWGATFTKYTEIADPSAVLIGTNEAALYFKDDGAGTTVLAYEDSLGVVSTLTGASTSYGNSVTVNLSILRNASVPTTQLDVKADRISVSGFIKQSLQVTVDSTTTGANALDTGTRANSTLYIVWVIYNKTTNTFAGLLSTSETAPTMPSGYTIKRAVGAWRTDGSANFLDGGQLGKTFYFVVPIECHMNFGIGMALTTCLSGKVPTKTASAAHLLVYMNNTLGSGIDKCFRASWASFTSGVCTAAISSPAMHGNQSALWFANVTVPLRNPADRSTMYADSQGDLSDIYLSGFDVEWGE